MKASGRGKPRRERGQKGRRKGGRSQGGTGRIVLIQDGQLLPGWRVRRVAGAA